MKKKKQRQKKKLSLFPRVVVACFVLLFVIVSISTSWEIVMVSQSSPKKWVTIVRLEEVEPQSSPQLSDKNQINLIGLIKEVYDETPHLITSSGEVVIWEGSYLTLAEKMRKGFPFELEVRLNYGLLTYIDIENQIVLMLLSMSILLFALPFVVYPRHEYSWDMFLISSGLGIKTQSEVIVPKAMNIRRKYYYFVLGIQMLFVVLFCTMWCVFWGWMWQLFFLILPLGIVFIIFYQQKYIPHILVVVFLLVGGYWGYRSINWLICCETQVVEATICYVTHKTTVSNGESGTHTTNNYYLFVTYDWDGKPYYNTCKLSDRSIIGVDLIPCIPSGKLSLAITTHDGQIVIDERGPIVGAILTGIGSFIFLLLGSRLLWGWLRKKF